MNHKRLSVFQALLMLAIVGCAGSNSGSTPGTSSSSSGSGQHVYVGACDESGIPFGGGMGTAASPYLMCSVSHWNSLANPLYSSAYLIFVSDIDVTGVKLIPVATFSGNLDGKGHIFSNWSGAGNLFQTVTGTIANLNVTNVNVIGSYRLGMVQTVGTSGVISNITLSGKMYGPYMSGGIAGVNNGLITGCSVQLNISGNDTIGGIVGVNAGQIQNSKCSGSVSVANLNTEIVTPDYGLDFGGIAACNFGGSITTSSSSCQVTGIFNTGGLVGELRSGSITDSWSSGVVSGTGTFIGGLIGMSDATSAVYNPTAWPNLPNVCRLQGAADNTSGGTISNSYSIASVQGAGSVGGLIGLNSSTITNSFSAGAVTSTGSPVGGLVGTAFAGSVVSAYWDTQVSGQATSAAGTAETTSGMQTSGTYSGWDFAGTWNSPTTGSYPSLQQ